MKNVPLLVGTIIGTLILVIGIAVVFSNSSDVKGGEQTVSDAAFLEGDTPHVKGAVDAPVTVVKFSDFQCPGCASVSVLIDQVLAEYPEEMRVIYRHFPLSSHPYARQAAIASEAAAEFGLFWEYHDLLFGRQVEWSSKSPDEVAALFESYAEELGIDTVAFQEKIQSEQIRSRVTADLSVANQLQLNVTPSLYVNGNLLSAPSQLQTTVVELLESGE